MTQIRILDNATHNSINPIALPQNLIMDQSRPSRRRNKIRGSNWTGDGEETGSPGDEIVEVYCWRSDDDAVEIMRKHLGGFDALTAAKRASQVVRFTVRSFIEVFDQFLPGDDTSMKTSQTVSIILIERT